MVNLKDYVLPKYIAKELKDRFGFEGPCDHKYIINKTMDHVITPKMMETLRKQEEAKGEKIWETIDAPTCFEAAIHLQERYGIYIVVEPKFKEWNGNMYYSYPSTQYWKVNVFFPMSMDGDTMPIECRNRVASCGVNDLEEKYETQMDAYEAAFNFIVNNL